MIADVHDDYYYYNDVHEDYGGGNDYDGDDWNDD